MKPGAMPPKKNDPFNFDDFYKAAGADGFIKKPLAELKKEKGSGGGTVGTTAPGTQQTQGTSEASKSRLAPEPVHSRCYAFTRSLPYLRSGVPCTRVCSFRASPYPD